MAVAVESDEDLQPLLASAEVIAIGPGLGQDDWGRAMFRLTLASGKPLVLDADALNLLSQSPHELRDAILTPHPGEAARLLGISIHEVQLDRVTSAQTIAQQYNAVVVLKGAGTLIAAPNTTPRMIEAGNPGMATGGMGDLLTGVIASLRGQGLSAFDAASAGALLHSLAGDEAAKEGERGLLPSDLLPHLRRLANP
jgi:NAD(P)H-hydrate epimerase